MIVGALRRELCAEQDGRQRAHVPLLLRRWKVTHLLDEISRRDVEVVVHDQSWKGGTRERGGGSPFPRSGGARLFDWNSRVLIGAVLRGCLIGTVVC